MNSGEATTPRRRGPGEGKWEGLHSPAFEPLFLGDWVTAVFIHYAVDAGVLQQEVPFELDLFEGRAFVSLVAFSMRRLRPCFGGRLTELLFKPVATTRYLNVRTYVRHGHETGIYFIAEFLSNALCLPLGSPTFGLPYRFGRLSFRHTDESGAIKGTIGCVSGRRKLSYSGTVAWRAGFGACPPGTRDAFLMERYTAFTRCGNNRRLFRIRHPPWLQTRAEIEVCDDGLLATTGEWSSRCRLVGANFSPGVHDVSIGWPRRIDYPERKRRLTVFFEV